jgi:hypothetical protein
LHLRKAARDRANHQRLAYGAHPRDGLDGIEAVAGGAGRQARSEALFAAIGCHQKPIKAVLSRTHRDTISDMQSAASSRSSTLTEGSAPSAAELMTVVRSQAEKITALEHQLVARWSSSSPRVRFWACRPLRVICRAAERM